MYRKQSMEERHAVQRDEDRGCQGFANDEDDEDPAIQTLLWRSIPPFAETLTENPCLLLDSRQKSPYFRRDLSIEHSDSAYLIFLLRSSPRGEGSSLFLLNSVLTIASMLRIVEIRRRTLRVFLA
eukprot:TRINITY_DN9307_c0_g2_i1.p3 TRINITY_DN9307_c0_g2~~TRINITY_DN9307_c0_g2_i1.p3  ORF type:complete len:125 (-),score=7.54 TRINITY_DN9307_c0_g2_i1:1344-1718(-)